MPDEAGIGDAPHSIEKDASERRRSPPVAGRQHQGRGHILADTESLAQLRDESNSEDVELLLERTHLVVERNVSSTHRA